MNRNGCFERSKWQAFAIPLMGRRTRHEHAMCVVLLNTKIHNRIQNRTHNKINMNRNHALLNWVYCSGRHKKRSITNTNLKYGTLFAFRRCHFDMHCKMNRIRIGTLQRPACYLRTMAIGSNNQWLMTAFSIHLSSSIRVNSIGKKSTAGNTSGALQHSITFQISHIHSNANIAMSPL